MAQLFFEHLIAPGRHGPRSIERRAMNRLRRFVTRWRDPLVTYRIGDATIEIPLSHELPHHQLQHPNYGQNLVRLVAALDTAWPDLSIVDVGANVGDTLAWLRTVSAAPVLCIDGDRSFAPVLRRNVARFENVEIAECYVDGDLEKDDVSGRVVRHGGTATALPGACDIEGVPLRPLADLLADRPRFATARFIKIDTDGFDAAILRGAAQFLADHHPLLFFEFDPHFMAAVGDDRGPRILVDLWQMGYSDAIVWENTGEYVTALPLDDATRRDEIVRSYTGFGGLRYCDIAVFAPEHADVLRRVRDGELKQSSER